MVKKKVIKIIASLRPDGGACLWLVLASTWHRQLKLETCGACDPSPSWPWNCTWALCHLHVESIVIPTSGPPSVASARGGIQQAEPAVLTLDCGGGPSSLSCEHPTGPINGDTPGNRRDDIKHKGAGLVWLVHITVRTCRDKLPNEKRRRQTPPSFSRVFTQRGFIARMK